MLKCQRCSGFAGHHIETHSIRITGFAHPSVIYWREQILFLSKLLSTVRKYHEVPMRFGVLYWVRTTKRSSFRCRNNKMEIVVYVLQGLGIYGNCDSYIRMHPCWQFALYKPNLSKLVSGVLVVRQGGQPRGMQCNSNSNTWKLPHDTEIMPSIYYLSVLDWRLLAIMHRIMYHS